LGVGKIVEYLYFKLTFATLVMALGVTGVRHMPPAGAVMCTVVVLVGIMPLVWALMGEELV
jgi:hypothetical protein